MTGPPTSPPLVGVVWTPKGEGKAAEQSTRDWGFLPQQRDCHKTAFHSSRGLVLLRFQSCEGQQLLENELICMEILKRKQELELTELEVE